MERYVPRSGWAEQKTSRESCCGKTAIHHTCQSFDERKIVVLRSDASDKTAKQSESDDHFRLSRQSAKGLQTLGIESVIAMFRQLSDNVSRR